jgi:hypothetical protein
MPEQERNLRKDRDQLVAERNRLFHMFLENPLEIRLASEIKVIDDQVAEYNERIRAEDKNAGLHEKKPPGFTKVSSRIERPLLQKANSR